MRKAKATIITTRIPQITTDLNGSGSRLRHMEALVELAVLQNKPLEVLMDELGVGPVAYESDQKN